MEGSSVSEKELITTHYNNICGQVHDYLKLSEIPAYKNLFNNETVIFSYKVKKTNMFEWTQERTLCITNIGIYNLDKKKIKRRIEIAKLGGVSRNV